MFDGFQKYLDEEYPQYRINIHEHLIPRMKDIVIDTILSTKSQLNQKQRKYCFELLGYDFLIDEDFRTWLLEVNNNPFLGFQNKEQYALLQCMIKNMMNITVNPLVNNNQKVSSNERENQFELIYSDA